MRKIGILILVSYSVIAAVGVLAVTAVSYGQQPTAPQAGSNQKPSTKPSADETLRRLVAQREPLARYIPIEASFYFRMSDPHKWESVFGGASEPDQPPDNAILPVGSTELRNQLTGQERVIAMPTWRNRKEAITICKPQDPVGFTKLLKPPEGEVITKYPGVEIYRSKTKLWVASDSQVFVFSDIGPGSAIFEQSARLLTGNNHKSLLDDQRFQRYIEQAAENSSGVLFFDESWEFRQGQEDVYQQYRPRWLPNLESACVEIQFESGLIRCALRAKRRERQAALKNAIQAKQLKLFPHNTMAAWIAPVHVESFVAAASRILPKGKSSFYWQVARRLIDADMTGILSLSEIGPRYTFCLLGGKDASPPRMAIIVEAGQAAGVAEVLAEICQGLVRIINVQQAHTDEIASFSRETYKGYPVYQINLPGLEEPTGPSGSLLEMHPAFGAINDQLVVASNPDAIKDLIAAHQSPEYAQPLFAEWAAASTRADDHTQIRAFLNPAATARCLVPWQQAMADSNSELLQGNWFRRLRDYFSDTPVQLGARLGKDNPQAPGKVYVLGVLEGRPAYGKLKPGDYIIAIDGDPLELENTREDLRKKLLTKASGGQRILRVERYGQFKDIAIDLPRVPHKSFHGLLTDTSNAIRYLQRLGKVVDRITYRQFGSNPRELNAEILFHLVTTNATSSGQ